MRVHEYQGRALMQVAGIPVPPAEVVDSAEQVRAAFDRLDADLVVVKAQAHAGDRAGESAMHQ